MDIASVICYQFFFLVGLVVGNLMSVKHNIDIAKVFFTDIWPQLKIYTQIAQTRLYLVYTSHIFPFINENFLKKNQSDDGDSYNEEYNLDSSSSSVKAKIK
jgi:hypothetical protein